MNGLEKTYIIFRKKKFRIQPQMQVVNLADLIQQMQSGNSEDVQLPQRSEKPKFRVAFQFIKTVSNLKEVAEIVRSSPLEEYVLFEGVMHTLTSPIQVLLDGKPVETLEAEWTVDPGIEITDDIRSLEIDEADADLVIPPYNFPDAP